MVNSYNDPSKQRARGKQRDFIRKNMPTYKALRNLRVVCFPGAEVDGEEALEVKEIYDELGIPRENVWGLEMDPIRAERLRIADMGIHVVNQNAYDFFRTTTQTFDVVSLDYTGQRTWREKDITRFIAGRGLLSPFGIYCTNHAIKRESAAMQRALLGSFISPYFLQDVYGIPANITGDDFTRELNLRLQKMDATIETMREKLASGKINLDMIRNGITTSNVLTLADGILGIDPKKHLLHKNRSIKEFAEEQAEPAPLVEKELEDKGIAAEYPNYWAYRGAIVQGFNQAIHDIAGIGYTRELATSLMQILGMHYHNGYLVKNIERYTYTSNKNYRMLSDLIQVEKLPRGLIRNTLRIIDVDNEGLICPNPLRLSSGKYAKAKDAVLSEVKRARLEVRMNPPIELGSSWQPPKRKSKISKDGAIDLLRDGCSTSEIEECYSGFTRMQLAALKAHYVTMRKEMNPSRP